MNLEFHPLADLFPLMDGAEFDALVADIREHGQREPIVLHDGKILDGRNRYRACLAASIEPVVHQWDGQGTPHAFVVSRNLHRRHLKESQRAMVAAKLANIARGEVGGGHPQADRHMCLPAAASLLNVSLSTVKNARTVLREGTLEEIAAVESGEDGVRPIADQIRAKIPRQARAKKRAAPLSQVGKNPERIQNSQLNAEIWGRLSDAIIGLTSLPSPSDVVAIVNGNVNRRRVVNERLARATLWIGEFSDAWTAISDR